MAAPEHRDFRHWRDAYGADFNRVFEVELGTDVEAFHGRAEFTPLQHMAIGHFDYSSVTYRRTPERVRAGPSDQLILQFNRRGGAVGDYGGNAFAMGPGEVGAFYLDAMGGHRTQADNAGMLLGLPWDLLPSELPRRGALVLTGRRARVLTGFVEWLFAALPRAEVSDLPAIERAAAAAAAACLDVSGATDPEHGESGEAIGTMALARAIVFIRERCAEPLDVEQVAAAALVSRATLYRLFQPLGGVAEQIWLSRLEHARRWLSDPARPGTIESIAHASGFATAQHFSRRFRDHYGFSPRNLRPF